MIVKTVCAWCKVTIKEGELIDGKVSYGICPKCKAKFVKDNIKTQRKPYY